MPPLGTVLLLHSHVVHGAVGSRAAVLPLQLQGMEADTLQVCQLSTHPGYGIYQIAVTRQSAEDVARLLSALRLTCNLVVVPSDDSPHGLSSEYVGVLIGYLGRSDLLPVVHSRVLGPDANFLNPTAVRLVDPVCGDAGRMYVETGVPVAYTRCLLPFADIATPNGFEASLLTGECVDGVVGLQVAINRAEAACRWFHDVGVKMVVITSFSGWVGGQGSNSLTGEVRGIDEVVGGRSDEGEQLWCMASYRAGDGARERSYVAVFEIPKLEGHFSGTGDLLAALLLAAAVKNVGAAPPTRITTSERGFICGDQVEAALNVVHHVIRYSVGNRKKVATHQRPVELDLVGCLDALRDHDSVPRAVRQVWHSGRWV